MNSFELNKIAGGVLGALTFVMLTSFVGELLFAEKQAAKAGYDLPMPEGTATAAAPAKPAAEPIAVRLASADKAKGENTFKQCSSCHTNEKGGANRSAPRSGTCSAASRASSPASPIRTRSRPSQPRARSGTSRRSTSFIEAPKGYLPGTTMSFAGISNPRTRADLIAYLNTLNDTPLELPKP